MSMDAASSPPQTEDGVPEPVADNPVLKQEIWNAMHKRNDNWMGAVCGATGSGKSWASLRIAEVIDPNFTVDQIAFSVPEFLELVIDDSLGRGSMIVLEEASVMAASEDFMSKTNKAIRQVSDTWRHQCRGALLTLPAFGRLDSGVRGRMSALLQMMHVDKDAGLSRAKFKYIQQNSDTGKLYKKYPYVDGKQYQQLLLQKPSKELREAYEERKANFTQDLNRELLEELKEELDESEGGDPDTGGPVSIADEIIAEGKLGEYIAENNGQEYIDRDLIELEYGIGARVSKKVKKKLQQEVPDAPSM